MTWDWADLLEAWCEEFSPETFYEQTARTFIAATKGRAKARERNAERDLILAYDDPLGVTAAFNRNLLVRINRELGGNFDLAAFAHRAVWNAAHQRVHIGLLLQVVGPNHRRRQRIVRAQPDLSA